MFIDAADVRHRDKAGTSLSYVEGHRVVQTLNELFTNNWSFELKDGSPVTITDRGVERKDGKAGWEIGCKAVGKIIIACTNQSFEDVGYGSGTSYNSPFDAHEGAGKEAVTDCLKRCARNLGNAFGLALYDKEQEAVFSMDSQGWSKFSGLVQRHTSLETQAEIDTIKDKVKEKYNIKIPSDMRPFMWREILHEAWPIYWDSFIAPKHLHTISTAPFHIVTQPRNPDETE